MRRGEPPALREAYQSGLVVEISLRPLRAEGRRANGLRTSMDAPLTGSHSLPRPQGGRAGLDKLPQTLPWCRGSGGMTGVSTFTLGMPDLDRDIDIGVVVVDHVHDATNPLLQNKCELGEEGGWVGFGDWHPGVT